MTYSDEARRRLGEAVRARREELGLAQRKLQVRGGPSVVTVGNVEKATGDEPSRLTLAGLDRALDWKSGSAALLLAGGDAEPRGFADHVDDEIQKMKDEIVERGLREAGSRPVGLGLDAAADGLTAEQIQPVLDVIRLARRAAGLIE